MSNMVKSEENMTYFKNAETQVTVVDSRKLTRKNMSIGMATRDVMGNFIA